MKISLNITMGALWIGCGILFIVGYLHINDQMGLPVWSYTSTWVRWFDLSVCVFMQLVILAHFYEQLSRGEG